MSGSQEIRINSERPPGGKALHTMEKLHPLTTMGGKVFAASVPLQVAWV